MLVQEATSRYGLRILRNRAVGTGDISRWAHIVYLSFTAQLVLFLVITAVSISFFRPTKLLLSWNKDQNNTDMHSGKLIGIGVAGGVSAVILVCLALWNKPPGGGILSISLVLINTVAPAYATTLALPVTLVIVVATAICLELFLRGVVFRSFAVKAGLPAGIAANCLVSYWFWPLPNPVSGVIFGLVSAVLFYQLRTLWPSVIACGFFVTLLGPFEFMSHNIFFGTK
jgi:membrane protease YdiL (CAAX protease family)